MSTIFSQQILGNELLLVDKKVISITTLFFLFFFFLHHMAMQQVTFCALDGKFCFYQANSPLRWNLPIFSANADQRILSTSSF